MLLERTPGIFMIQILFLDQDRFYCQQVCSRINSLSGRFRCYDLSLRDEPPEDICDISLLRVDWERTLVLYHPQQFFHPPQDSYVMLLNESPSSTDSCFDASNPIVPGIYKFGTVHEILDAIESFLSDHPALAAADRKASLMCVIGSACPGIRRNAIENVRQKKLSQGLKVIQIDFCPSYLSDYPLTDSSGNTLSDALLRIMADDLSFEDFGTFLIPRPDGSFQFRPAGRADDLFECTPAYGRKFVELLRKWIIHTHDQYFVIIQCVAIPFSLIYSIAVLSDELCLVNQEGSALQTASYNKEIGFLLANLPGSCNLQETISACSDFH